MLRCLKWLLSQYITEYFIEAPCISFTVSFYNWLFLIDINKVHSYRLHCYTILECAYVREHHTGFRVCTSPSAYRFQRLMGHFLWLIVVLWHIFWFLFALSQSAGETRTNFRNPLVSFVGSRSVSILNFAIAFPGVVYVDFNAYTDNSIFLYWYVCVRIW